MRADQLATAIRRAAFIPDAHDEYTDAVLLSECNSTLANVFGDLIATARAGYWLKQYNTTTTANAERYRIPPRALMGGLERVELGNTSGLYRPLIEATPAEIPQAQGNSSSNSASPRAYYIEGDHLVLLPKPSVSGLPLRLSYYIRPSQIVTQQITGTERGRITAVDPTARTIVVNAVPFDESLGSPAAITTGNQLLDVVKPTGWHELCLVGASQTLTSLTFTVGGSDSVTDIEVGDYVRAADQTDWPCLPDEFHQMLADATAVRVLMQLALDEKATALARKIGLIEQAERVPGTDMARFIALLRPRVKASPKVVVRRTGLIAQQASFRRWH